MGSMSDVFVRKVTDDAIAAIRAMVGVAELMTNSEYIRVLGVMLREQELMELSSRLETDVMWLSYHSVTDGLEYYHWQAGRLVRALGYGLHEERIWERIEGQPEAWERQFFFDPDDLALLLDDSEEDEADRFSDEERRRLEQFWRAGELVIGKNIPILGAQSCAFHIATYYRFPGWDFERTGEA